MHGVAVQRGERFDLRGVRGDDNLAAGVTRGAGRHQHEWYTVGVG